MKNNTTKKLKPLTLTIFTVLILCLTSVSAHDFGQYDKKSPKASSNDIRTATVVHADSVRKKVGAGQDKYDLLVSGEETDGQYFLMEGTITPGGRAPSHIQTREEEGFYIIQGELHFYADDQEVIARAGTFINIPKGVKHHFENKSGRNAKMLIFLSPSGLEKWFEAAGKDPKNAKKLGEEKYGLEFIQDTSQK